MSNLKTVQGIVTIAGKPCQFVYLKLHQSFNSHHTFEIKVDYNQLDIAWMANPINLIKLIGKDVNIVLIHRNSGDQILFNGIITNVSMNGQHGQQNHYTITGCSPTILLDGEKTMNSFMDLDLNSIANEAIEKSGNGAEVTVNPVFKGKIDYISQYNQTCFEFLNQLSWLYGEVFFYNGTTCYFGKPDYGNPVPLIYDVDMTHFDLNANLVPPKAKRFEYLNHMDSPINLDLPDTIPGVRGYIKVALDQASQVYSSDANIPLNASIQTMKELEDLVKVDKYRMVSQMLVMKGSTHTCKVKIGKLISVNLPSSMKDVSLKHVETFLVTEATYELDQNERFSNSFTAIPSEMENIPMQPVQSSYAFPQIAWVTSNADSKGRVKVETQWQRLLQKTTNWIRVQTPDSGSSDKVSSNRGFVFIPEEGDIVMLNFENGDPNRPYVTGSIFSETVGVGGGQGNKTKSLTTRSGSTITLDDNQGAGSVTMSDPSGNVVVMDGAGNVTITAPNTMTFKCKDLVIDAGNSIKIDTGSQGDGTLTIKAKESIEATAETKNISLTAKAKEIKLTAKTKLSLEGKEEALLKKDGSNKILIAGSIVDIDGGQQVQIN